MDSTLNPDELQPSHPNSLLSPCVDLTEVVASSYNALMAITIHSSTPPLVLCPPQYLPWYSVKSLLQVHKCDPQLLVLCQKLFLNLPNYEYSISGPSSRPETKPHVIN